MNVRRALGCRAHGRCRAARRRHRAILGRRGRWRPANRSRRPAAGRCQPSGALRDGDAPRLLTTRRSAGWPQSAHLTLGFSHTPGRHSFRQRGDQPVLPGLLVLSQRVAKTSGRPRNSDVNNATRPSAVVTSGPPGRPRCRRSSGTAPPVRDRARRVAHAPASGRSSAAVVTMASLRSGRTARDRTASVSGNDKAPGACLRERRQRRVRGVRQED